MIIFSNCSSHVHNCFTNFPANFRRLTALIANQTTPTRLCPSASRFAAAAKSRQTRRPSPRSSHVSGHRSLVESVKAISPRLNNNPYSALTASQNHLHPGQTLPRVTTYSTPTSVKPTNSEHIYWCTVCDNHSYQHSDSWKKHEKEHEITYVCMLKESFEPTKDGRRCVFCGALNQADSHHSAHNVVPCVEAVDRPTFKRRYDMVGHLKDVHHIPDGGCIADKWRCQSPKKAWSCGFCVKLFPSLQSRLKHIGTDHFEKGRSINDWDFAKVIQGLLLQPEIQEAWQHLLKPLGPVRLSEINWIKFGNEKLQLRLERGLTGKETPEVLAQAAYDGAEHDYSPAADNAMAFATTMVSTPNQYAGNALSHPIQTHAVASGENSLQYQPWSSPQHQASEIPGSAFLLETQNLYGAPSSSFSHANIVAALDYGSVRESVASDTDGMNSTRRTSTFSPANPSVYTNWNAYNLTPGSAHGDHEPFHQKDNEKIDWSIMPSDIDVRNIHSTIKCLRDSPSPPAETPTRKRLLTDMSRKRTQGKESEKCETTSQGFNLGYVQGRIYDNDGTPSDIRANSFSNDGL